jgi:hypothetical protein
MLGTSRAFAGTLCTSNRLPHVQPSLITLVSSYCLLVRQFKKTRIYEVIQKPDVPNASSLFVEASDRLVKEISSFATCPFFGRSF